MTNSLVQKLKGRIADEKIEALPSPSFAQKLREFLVYMGAAIDYYSLNSEKSEKAKKLFSGEITKAEYSGELPLEENSSEAREYA